MRINHGTIATFSTEKLIERHPGQLTFNVPEGHIDGTECGHRNRATPEVGTSIKKLPNVFAGARVHPDQVWNNVILQIDRG